MDSKIDLESLSGFQRLSPSQKQVILDSLKIQERADQGDPEAMEMINRWFCHAGVVALEDGGFNETILNNIPENFQRCDFKFVRGLGPQLLNHFVAIQEHPKVIHILLSDPQDYVVYHSITTLGVNSDGQVVIWEKRAAEKPFKIEILRNLFEIFPKYEWGIRDLNILSE